MEFICSIVWGEPDGYRAQGVCLTTVAHIRNAFESPNVRANQDGRGRTAHWNAIQTPCNAVHFASAG
jgi:hypothetical protein